MIMKTFNKKTALVAASILYSAHGYAGMAELAGKFSTELERQSALAVLDTYNDLIEHAGCVDRGGLVGAVPTESFNLLAAAPTDAVINGECTGQTFQLFSNLRALIHTANEITEDGNSQYSLHVDATALGKALRWDTGEEYAAQGSLSSDYLRGQVSSLSSRLSALRLGAQGFRLQASNSDTVTGGSAGDAGENFSQWGGFINYAYGDGTKAPTGLEDAFDFDGKQFNAGVDYRINNEWIVGGLISRISQRVDFDSSKSVVSGNVDSSGYSFFPFAMYQLEHFYISTSVGYQKLKFDSLRAIKYQSFNPDVPSVDTASTASTDATNTSFFFGTGYNFSHQNLSFEPFFNFNALQTKIDGFTEKDVNDSAFDLAVSNQKINSHNTTLGATLRYTFTPSFGVLTPFATYEFVNQSQDKHAIAAHYVNAASAVNVFGVPTDSIDKNYTVATVGLSSVLVGAHEKTADGIVAGGVQAFVQYKKVQNLRDYDVDMIEVGLRYEF